jgi:hypothetical protein
MNANLRFSVKSSDQDDLIYQMFTKAGIYVFYQASFGIGDLMFYHGHGNFKIKDFSFHVKPSGIFRNSLPCDLFPTLPKLFFQELFGKSVGIKEGSERIPDIGFVRLQKENELRVTKLFVYVKKPHESFTQKKNN